MVLLPVKQYYPQTDSATRHGDRMCFSSTCAMAIKYLLPDALKGSNADDDYLKTVLKFGDTTQYTAQIKACQQYGVKATFRKTGNRTALLKELQNGKPVAVGILHHGPATAPRGGGHWMLLIGDDGLNGIFHDPYGELNNPLGGYVRIGSGGKEVRYSWHNWLKRWEVEGANTGWYMTFESVSVPNKPQRPSFENNWDGVKAAAKYCGARWPQVVAAQWALESGWGKHTSGRNNYFGIKSNKEGQGTLKRTTEFVRGMQIHIDAWFKDYIDLFECIDDLVTKWYKDYKTYKGVNRATSPEECARLLIIEGYATDPAYTKKLIDIFKQND